MPSEMEIRRQLRQRTREKREMPTAPVVQAATASFREEYLADNVRLMCGDCREIIPTLDKVDAVITDPPFGIENIVGMYGRTSQRASGEYSDHNIANDRDLNVTVEAFDLIKKQFNNLWLVSFYSCRITPTFFEVMKGFEYFGEVVWDKLNIGLGTQIRYRHENVAFFRIGQPPELQQLESVLPYSRIMREDKTSFTRSLKSTHPHEKPEAILRSLIEATPGKTILDPFAGTGTTGAAAIHCRRGFIGIEFDPKYYDIARRKIGDALKQPVAFWEDY
jgi:site-specific DNA-methyltransferase (adenine-specific)